MLHWAILPNLSESVNLVVATIGESEEVELSSLPDDSGEPGRFLVRSFLIFVRKTGSVGLSFFLPVFLVIVGGVMPGTFMISPDVFLGRGGGGCLLGSVGLSNADALGGLRSGGGVMGLGRRRGIGEGDGGRGRDLGLGEACCFVCGLFRERETDADRDRVRACLWFLGEQTEQESSEQLLTELPDGDLRPLWGAGERGLTIFDERAAGGDDLRVTGDRRGSGDLGDLRLTGERLKGGDRGDLRPIGDLRDGGDRGDLRPTGDRERLRRLGDGDDEPSTYNDL